MNKLINDLSFSNLLDSLKRILKFLLASRNESMKKIVDLEKKIEDLPTEGGGSNERNLEQEAFMAWVISENVVDGGNNARIINDYDPEKHGKYFYNAGFIDFDAIEGTEDGGETNYKVSLFRYENYLLGDKRTDSFDMFVPKPPSEILAPDNPPTYNLEAENQLIPENILEDLKGKSYVVLSWVE